MSHVCLCVCRFLLRKLVQYKSVSAPQHCVAGVQPYAAFLLKNQPDTPLPDPTEPSKPLPKPHPVAASTTSTRGSAANGEEKPARRLGRQAQTKQTKSVAQREKQDKPSGLLLENSEHSSEGEWSESDGELIIDTQGAGHGAGHKKEVGKRKKEGVVVKKERLDEEEGGEGM